MSTLPEITEAFCARVAKGDLMGARALTYQAAAKMGGERCERLKKLLSVQTMTPLTSSKHWTIVNETRKPWVPDAVLAQVQSWLDEAKHADALIDAGEKVLPLLLSGETRCGKTSLLCSAAADLNLPVHRLSLSTVVESFMGQTAIKMRAALAEAITSPPALWLIDEIDGVAMSRSGGGAGDKERAHALAVLLVDLESLPPSLMLAATTNMVDMVDPAVLARFRVVRFPAWENLTVDDKTSFVHAHGISHPQDAKPWPASYSDAVAIARAQRVARIIAGANG